MNTKPNWTFDAFKEFTQNCLPDNFKPSDEDWLRYYSNYKKRNMKTLKQVPLELVEVEFIPNIENMEFGKLYFSKEYKTTNHLCPCGCGQQTPIPVKEGEWNLVVQNGKATISPSIAHRLGCQSHYIITNGNANIV